MEASLMDIKINKYWFICSVSRSYYLQATLFNMQVKQRQSSSWIGRHTSRIVNIQFHLFLLPNNVVIGHEESCDLLLLYDYYYYYTVVDVRLVFNVVKNHKCETVRITEGMHDDEVQL